ncbi:uncharacterized protein LOC125751222 isoform X2 [Brienomyrus brachyistius]|uniref:uncharacterized protein LOC125751222 isoform X2 n=1 Tax=Brienomyrus brachyistius TaxID=42636 RepID=UPI0020B1FD2B|nr:uncharacterized protein LOC125751222 isoform X2 [Brienomyrus brachyistius]
MDIQAHLLSWAILSFLSGVTSVKLQCCIRGETIYLHIQNNSIKSVQWKYGDNAIATSKISYKFSTEVFQNFTLKMTNIQKNWTGDITASGYDSDGKHVLTEKHHLVVLGHPVVEFLTCTHGTSVLHCADDSGEDTLYTWTVRDDVLGEEKVFSTSCKYISVEVISGSVHCTVQKKSCSAQSEPVSFNCTKTPTAWCPTALTGVSVLILCLTVAWISFCFLRWYKKHRLSAKSENSSVSPTPVNEDIVYSEVRVAKQCR